jgi:hypothetical protein
MAVRCEVLIKSKDVLLVKGDGISNVVVMDGCEEMVK